jgi:hypothetical protein
MTYEARCQQMSLTRGEWVVLQKNFTMSRSSYAIMVKTFGAFVRRLLLITL